MAETQLDRFLTAGNPPEEAAPAPTEPPQQTEAPVAPEPQKSTDAPEPAAAEAPEPTAADGRIPVAVLAKARNDWKAEAIRKDEQLAALQQQLEELKRAPAAPPPQAAQQVRIPDPNQDPAAYAQFQRVNDRLDMSEMLLRQQIGNEAVDKLTEDFKALAASRPALYAELHVQKHPYDWARQQVETARFQAEVGTDPAAYRSKLIAEERAKWEAETAARVQQAPPVSPAAGLPPSLANVRSAAPRAAGAFTGPADIEDIVGRRSGDIFKRTG